MITLHLEAGTIAELRQRLREILDDTVPGPPLHRSDGLDQPERPGGWAVVGTAKPEPQEPVQSDKPRRAHRRVRPVEAPVAAPVTPLEIKPDPLEEAFGVLTAEADEDEAELEAINVSDDHVGDAVSNELLKREVISSLADMFTAGNVKVVRHVLHKYGRGAKSFPEIDPAHFPEIKAALDRNEAA